MPREEDMYPTKAMLQKAHDYFDSIVDYYPTTEFLEVTGLRGGESHTYRFYYNGLITER